MSVAGVAHLVERHLAKVEVASSSLVARSIEQIRRYLLFFYTRVHFQIIDVIANQCVPK